MILNQGGYQISIGEPQQGGDGRFIVSWSITESLVESELGNLVGTAGPFIEAATAIAVAEAQARLRVAALRSEADRGGVARRRLRPENTAKAVAAGRR